MRAIGEVLRAVATAALVAVGVLCGAESAGAQEVMLITGTVSAGTNTPTPAAGYTVDLVNPFTSAVVDSTAIGQDGSTYAFETAPSNAISAQNPSLTLAMQLVIGCTSYQLLCTGNDCQGGTSAPLTFTYTPTSVISSSGQVPVSTFNLVIGSPISTNACGTSTTGSSSSGSTGTVTVGAGCPSYFPNCDVAGVGVFDQRAIAAMKQCLLMANPGKNCDVNGDGVVDTRDLIDLLRAYMQYQQQQAISAGTISMPATGSAGLSQ